MRFNLAKVFLDYISSTQIILIKKIFSMFQLIQKVRNDIVEWVEDKRRDKRKNKVILNKASYGWLYHS